MILSRRVYPPHTHGPAIAGVLLVSVIIMSGLNFAEPAISFYVGQSIRPALKLLAIAIPLGLNTLVQRSCRHLYWCWISGFIGIGGTLLLGVHLGPPGGRWIWSQPAIASNFFGLVGSGIIGGVLNIAWVRVVDWLFGKPLTQDGTFCPQCAYKIAFSPLPRCPECGREFTAAELTKPPAKSAAWMKLTRALFAALAIWGAVLLALPYVVVRLASWPGPSLWIHEYIGLLPQHEARVFAGYLTDGDDMQRAIGAECLRWLRDKPVWASSLLTRAVRTDPSALVRRVAIGGLSRAQLAEQMPGLVQHPDPDVRWTALAHFASGGVIVYPAGTPFLIQALDDPSSRVRGFVYNRLRLNTGKGFPYDPKAPREERVRQQAQWQIWWDAQEAQLPSK